MLNMIFTFDDFKHSEEVFAEFATVIGYPNLRASDTDKYQGLVNFENIRTGNIIFQGYDGIYIEFDEDESLIRFYSGVNKNNVLFVYKEHTTKITEAENKKIESTFVFNDIIKDYTGTTFKYKKIKKSFIHTYNDFLFIKNIQLKLRRQKMLKTMMNKLKNLKARIVLWAYLNINPTTSYIAQQWAILLFGVMVHTKLLG